MEVIGDGVKKKKITQPKPQYSLICLWQPVKLPNFDNITKALIMIFSKSKITK